MHQFNLRLIKTSDTTVLRKILKWTGLTVLFLIAGIAIATMLRQLAKAFMVKPAIAAKL
jgi:hypothetical protein